MSGPGSNTAVEEGLLKDTYEPMIAEAVLNKFPLRDVFKPKSAPWNGGKGLKWSAHVGRNTSPMAVGEDSALPNADSQKYVQGFIEQRKIFGRWRVTKEQLDFTNSSEGAYRSTRTENLQRFIDDVAYREEFYLGSDGRGVFALVDTGSSGTTVELDAPGNVTGNNFGNRFIQVGMYLATINPANGAIRSNTPQVTAVNSDGTDVTVSAAPSWTENDYVVQAANSSVTDALDTSYEKAPWGLNALLDDGTYRSTYFGIDRNTYTNYQSYVNASTGALSFDLLHRISDVVDQKLGGEIDAIWCHHSTRRLLILLGEADRRYSGASLMNPDGGTNAFKQGDITFGGVAVKAIRTIGLDQMFLVDTKGADFVNYISNKGQWEDMGGGILQRDGTGTSAKHAFEAWWYKQYQLFCRNPGKCARLDGITGQTLVIVRGE